MRLSVEMVARFQDFLDYETPDDPKFIMTRMSSETRCMVYGCNSPQVTVLGLCAMIDAAARHQMLRTLATMPGFVVRDLADQFISGAQSKKTTLEQASNYWLQKLSSYSGQTTKLITGSFEGEGGIRKGASDKKISSDKGKAARSLKDLAKEKHGFFGRMGTSAFDVADIVKAGPDVFDAKGAKGRQQTTHNSDMKMSDLVADAALRRACKFLIYDAISNGQQVVYLLDDLDLRKVSYLVTGGARIPKDARLFKGDANGKVPICTSEIREIFRCWDYLRRYVTFYEELVEVQPPWAAERGDQANWVRYAAHRAERLLKDPTFNISVSDGKALEDAAIAANEGNHGLAINKYHAANPSRYGRGASLHVVTAESEM